VGWKGLGRGHPKGVRTELEAGGEGLGCLEDHRKIRPTAPVGSWVQVLGERRVPAGGELEEKELVEAAAERPEAVQPLVVAAVGCHRAGREVAEGLVLAGQAPLSLSSHQSIWMGGPGTGSPNRPWPRALCMHRIPAAQCPSGCRS
jgi:hypothetical protein